ncbi:hypothetical protein [Streptomyces sp. NPDC004042]|uniref:hypothetical protein n=1 Tax=Streptomyces sp. NPDC004042 TaxID=3154451 RepID=UPI0033A38146
MENNLMIAVEVVERDGRRSGDDPNSTVHAYDVDKQDFAYHHLAGVEYIVNMKVSWELAARRRMRLCPDCANAHQNI